MNGTFLWGTGTESDPYLVEDVFDFCAIKNDADKETTYYQLRNNIEFNDHPIYKNGITGVNNIVNADKSVLDGNGKSIRNIVYYKALQTNTYIFTLKEIHNCNFENLVNVCSETSQRLFRVYNFNYCSFYILFQNSNFVAWAFSPTFTNCTFNFAGVASTGMTLNGYTFLRCHINFDNFTCPTAGSYHGGWNIFLNPNFDHVYCTGKIHFTGISSVADIFIHTPSGYASQYDGIIKNMYWCVETSDNASGATFRTQNANAVSFINKNLISRQSIYGGTNFYALTDEQAKDPAYLASIGFPVIGE